MVRCRCISIERQHLSIESKCGTTLMIGALLPKVATKVALKEEAMAEERTNKIEIALR